MNNKRPRFFYGYWILLVGFLCQVMMNGLTGYSVGLFVKPLQDEFTWGRAQLMGGSTVLVLSMGLAAPLVGKLLNRYSPRLIIALGTLIVAIGLALLSQLQYLWQFYFYYTIVGIGASAMGVVPNSMLVSRWFVKRRGLAMGILGTGIGVGGFLIPLFIGILLLPNYGWSTAYLVPGIITAVLIIPLALLLVRARPSDMGLLPDGETVVKRNSDGTKVKPAKDTGLSLQTAMRTPAFWLMGTGFITFAIANMALFQNQTPHLQDIGFSAAAAATAMSVVGIGSAFGKFGFGWLCDFIKAKYILVIGSVLQLTATLILLSIKPSSPIALIWLYSLILGLGIGSWLPALSMTVSSTFGLLAYGVIFGVMNMIFMGGGSIGPVIAGSIYDANQSYFWAFIMAIVLHCISIPAMLLVLRPKQ